MKATYLQPQLSLLDAMPCSIIATSNVNITVSSDEYDGEGRTKDASEWGDIWDNDNE